MLPYATANQIQQEMKSRQREDRLRHLLERVEHATANGNSTMASEMKLWRREYHRDFYFLLDSLCLLGNTLRSYPGQCTFTITAVHRRALL
jgi:hypothetical protein